MKRTTRSPTVQKLSNSKSVGFRPGEELRIELEDLAAELCRIGSRITVSDILREGVTAYWVHIRAYMRTRARAGNVPRKTAMRIIASALKAHQRGLDASDITRALVQAIEAKARR